MTALESYACVRGCSQAAVGSLRATVWVLRCSEMSVHLVLMFFFLAFLLILEEIRVEGEVGWLLFGSRGFCCICLTGLLKLLLLLLS